MTALALTAQPDTASIALAITGAPAGPVVITRTDANGTNPVRLRTGQTTSGGALAVVDYEPALTGVVSYDVVDSANARTVATETLEGTGVGPRLHAVQLPGLSHSPTLVTGYSAARPNPSTVLRVVNRVDPVVILAPAQTREGTLELFALDYAAALEAQAVAAASSLLMFRQADFPGMDMWLIPSTAQVDPLEETVAGWRWRVSLPYVETKPSSLPLLGSAGWTFDALRAGYATFAAVRSAFVDLNDLAVG